jgi:hypothetical protein
MDMHHSISLTLRSVVAISALTLSMSVRRQWKTARWRQRYVSLDVQSDNADATQFSGTGSFTLGKHLAARHAGAHHRQQQHTLGDLQHYGSALAFAPNTCKSAWISTTTKTMTATNSATFWRHWTG